MAKKKKETWSQAINAGKRESFKDWTIIQKALGVIFLIGITLAIIDMSCAPKEPTKTGPGSSVKTNP